MSILIKFEMEKELYNNGSSFGIYAVKPLNDDDKELQYNKYNNVVIKGFVGNLQLETEYRGRFNIKSDNYGYSYKLTGNVYSKPPESDEDIKDFIYYALTKQQAKEVWREYPNIIDLVMTNNEDKIDTSKLHNVGHIRIQSIITKIKRNYKHFEFISGLSEYDFSTYELNALEHMYNSIDKVKQAINDDPYQVFGEVLNHSVSDIDAHFLPDNPNLRKNQTRIKLVFNTTIRKINYNGGTLIKKEKVHQSLLPEYKFVYEAFDYLMEDSPYIIESNGYLGLKHFYEKEKDIFNWLMIAKDKPIETWDYDEKKYKDQEDIYLTDEQIGVIQSVCTYKYNILLGAAGSGKSSSIKALISYLNDTDKSFELMTPTGVSSSVLSDMTNEKSQTIHRALEFHPDKGFRRQAVNVDVLIVDEISMVGVELLYTLLSKVSNETRVIFVGDQSQLPSVTKGSIINNILNRELCNIIQLTKIFRYTSSGLVKVATDSRNGESWLKAHKQLTLGKNKDYIFMPEYDNDILQTLINVFDYMQNNCGIENVKILSAYKKGILGSKNINRLIKKTYNTGEDKSCFKLKDIKFHEDDIVMHRQNNYDVPGQLINKTEKFEYEEFVNQSRKMEVYNGEVGKVIYVRSNKLVVQYKNKYIHYDHSNIRELKHSYAMTIHKSQSATFQNVIMITPNEHKNMLNRNLLYTGMTRTAKRLVHIGSYKAINKSLSKSEHEDRITNLQFFTKEDIYMKPTKKEDNYE